MHFLEAAQLNLYFCHNSSMFSDIMKELLSVIVVNLLVRSLGIRLLLGKLLGK